MILNFLPDIRAMFLTVCSTCAARNSLKKISANCGEWQMALKLFDSLFKAGLTPDARTYSAVMIACFKGHQVLCRFVL